MLDEEAKKQLKEAEEVCKSQKPFYDALGLNIAVIIAEGPYTSANGIKMAGIFLPDIAFLIGQQPNDTLTLLVRHARITSIDEFLQYAPDDSCFIRDKNMPTTDEELMQLVLSHLTIARERRDKISINNDNNINMFMQRKKAEA